MVKFFVIDDSDARKSLVDKLRVESNDQIALIEYVVTNHK